MKVKNKYGTRLRIYESEKRVAELYYPASLKTDMRFIEKGCGGYVMCLNESVFIC